MFDANKSIKINNSKTRQNSHSANLNENFIEISFFAASVSAGSANSVYVKHFSRHSCFPKIGLRKNGMFIFFNSFHGGMNCMKQIFNRQSLTAVLFLLGLFFCAGSLNANAGVSVQNATIYGVTSGNQLVRFNSASPGALTTVGTISGLQAGEQILGIDFRPATGQLYGLGSTSRLYVIDKTTGAATAVSAAPFTPALTSDIYGFDFNPTVDRIRIVGSNGQNLRANPNNGTVINDGALNPGTPVVTAAAYTNNFAGATTTTLYVIDVFTDRLLIQSNPNAGTLTDVGPLGADFQLPNGFDFFSGTNTAYAVGSNAANQPILYTVNLTTGAATNNGFIGGSMNFTLIRAMAVDTGAPATAGFGVLALTTTNQLIRFNSNRASSPIGTPVAITGLQAGENILGIDFRPATGELFGLGSSSRLYRINPATGAAAAVGAAGGFTLAGTNFGFDFNPVPDRIRIISDTGQNLRANPNDGTAIVDGTLNPGTPSVTAAAYTNSFAGTTTTTLYTIDTASDTLNVQNPPNNGTQVPVGSIGFDATGVNGFDIANAGNVALAALQVNGSATSGLYRINLTTGATSFVSPINSTAPIRGLAITSGSAATNTLDFGGDRRADFSVFRASNNFVYISRPDNSAFGFPFGNSDDTFAPGDYDGDGRADVAVFRESTGTFFVFRSSDNTVTGTQFGAAGDEPVARDYDGDGRADFAVVRRSGGLMTWFVLNSSNNAVTGTQFGFSTDVTAPGDYDGDGRFDLAVYRGNGNNPAMFFVQRSSGGFLSMSFGLGSDLVVPGDYDGDGRTDFAVVRTGTNYQWYMWRSSDNSLLAVTLGTKGDLTVQNDYDGDGKTDVAVWRPTNGTYYFARSSSSFTLIQTVPFGQNGDYPIANYDTH
jgi:hypothetical protein